MSVTAQKALVGENGVRDYLNLWYPTHTPEGTPIVGQNKVVRIRSAGSKDIGDMGGIPYVSIEVKNHSNPNLGDLVDNAEWKGSNAGVGIWWLVYKRAGYGALRARYWHAATTIGTLCSGYGLTREDGSPVFGDDPDDDIRTLCAHGSEVLTTIHTNLYGITPAKYCWRFLLIFRNYVQRLEPLRLADINAAGEVDIDRGIIPVVVSPRVGRYDTPQRWYASTLLVGLGRSLETIGVLPQDTVEYEGKGDSYG